MSVTINIGGSDRTDKVEWPTFSLSRAITSQVDTCSFTVRRDQGDAGGNYKPELLDIVEVYEGATKIFGGQIVQMDSVIIDGADIEEFRCDAKDYSFDMDRQLVVATYENQAIEDIIDDIFTNFVDPSYTIANVSCPLIAKYVAFNYEYPSKCLQQLAELANYDWYVDADKDVHFFEKSTTPAPFSLTDTGGNYYYNTLTLKDSLTNLRNSVTVRGGQYLGSLSSESVIADGTELVFTQGAQYNDVFVKVNSSPLTVGIDYIDDPASYDCLYNFAEKFVRFKAGTLPSDGDTVEVGGYPYIPVIVKVKDSSSIAAFGEYEFKIIDKSINSKEGARDRARAELAAWGTTLNEGMFETSTAGLDTGQQITINSTIRGVNRDYVISRIQTRLRNGHEFLHTVTLVTTRTWGMIEFLMQLLTNKDKEIVINAGEVLDLVEAANETIAVSDGNAVTVSIAHNTQTETISVGDSTTVQALNYAVQFVAGPLDVPSGTKRCFILNHSPLA